MAVIIDFSTVSIAALLANQSEINFKLEEGYLRHVVLNSIRAITVKHRPVFGNEIVIATDARGRYWRDEVFPQYKWERRQKKKDSRFDWDMINAAFDKVRGEIKMYLPYKVVGFPRAEADDVIAVLAKHKAETPREEKMPPALGGQGLFDIPAFEPVLIVSGDSDFYQLQAYSNIKQFKNATKEFLVSEDPERDLKEKIIRGDTGDSIPNIMCEDNVIVEGITQKAMRQPLLDKYLGMTKTELYETTHFKRNERLIDFANIPNDIQEGILTVYKQAVVPPRKGIFQYFVDNRLQNLLSNLNDF